MELYASDATIGALEQALERQSGQAALETRVALAWHLRQRDANRALCLADAVEELLAGRENALMRARIALVRAECSLLLARMDEARSSVSRASEGFQAAQDAIGRGDAALLRARIAEVGGERVEEQAAYGEALRAYRVPPGDAERLVHARCAALLSRGFADPESTERELREIRAQAAALPEAARLHLRFVEGVAAFQRGDLMEAVAALTAVAARAYALGMCDQGFRAESGLVSSQSNLGDREASCTLAEAALARARQLGWPRAIGHALANFGRQLADSGQLERALESLSQAHAAQSAQPRSRGFAIASYYLGDAYLGLGRHGEALQHLEIAERLMRDLGSMPEVACLLAIQAQALSRLARAPQALERAQAALALARSTGSRLWEAEALRSLAEIHSVHRVAGDSSGRIALDHLREALHVVEEVGGHHERSQLYTEIARAHEAAGDLAAALQAERAARTEEVSESNRRAANRLLLARERHEAERQSERARELEAALGTLEQLRLVGQDVTSHLDPASMLQALHGHLVRLADVTLIAVFVFDAQGARLTRHCIENGRVLPVRDVSLADFESYAARAARERREIHVDAEEGGRAATRIPGTEVTRSLWFAPLLRGEELLGVLTVQSARVRAYGEREKLILRTVAGYAAVAFANARTHGELEAKHRRLIETEAEMRLLATTDPLTGLDNRRRFFAAAQSELARAMRYGGAVGLVMADLDRFKALNDEGGHAAGDRVMEAVAGVLREQQRPHDVVGRVGGEEFAFVLPGADAEATLRAAERIRKAVEALEIQHRDRRYRVTISMGCAAVAEAPRLSGTPAAELESLLREADAALYEAKRMGRNRTVCAPARAAQEPTS
ncbi:MAG TPA: sensor domain-containing diguanylate cyclase [Usitatibacter sp.]|nr:sensor domain-containing diguanylate cyclase [Usitatibacter sp.]